MSESSAKATRRELRRAVGAETVGVVGELQQNVQAVASSVTNAHKRIDGVTADLTAARRNVLELHAFVARGLWGRLRWLVLGR